MKQSIISILQNIRGVFLPREVRQSDLTKDIFDSVSTLLYHGQGVESKNIRKDWCNLKQDIRKELKKRQEVKVKVSTLKSCIGKTDSESRRQFTESLNYLKEHNSEEVQKGISDLLNNGLSKVKNEIEDLKLKFHF